MKMKAVASIIALLLLLAGCRANHQNGYQRYTDSFFDTFDTLVQVIAYTESEAEFSSYFAAIEARFQRLHKLYDIYNSYEGINNLKTINDHAGIEPVKVDQEIIALILFAKDMYGRTGGSTNIALGPVLRVWHEYREEGSYDPLNAELPPPEALRAAAQYTDINQVIVDTENNTVFLADRRMRLDVGAVAKGFAVELAAQEMVAQGLKSGVINAGGNIRVIGQPFDGVRERWGVGVQNPAASIVAEEDRLLDVVYISDAAVVSSGAYQRFYFVDGQAYHHLIDPETLMPASYFQSVTVVAGDSGIADFLSTALFLMPFAEGFALAESFAGVEAIWVMPDGKVNTTGGMKQMLRSYGATGLGDQ